MRVLARRRRKILGVGWSNYEKAPPLLLADFQQGGGLFHRNTPDESISKKIKKTGSFWTKNGAATRGGRSRGPEGAHSRELIHIIA